MNFLITYLFTMSQIYSVMQIHNKGKAFSTVEVYLAAIAACHVGFDAEALWQHPPVSHLQSDCNCNLWSYFVCVLMYFGLRASLEKRALSQLTFPEWIKDSFIHSFYKGCVASEANIQTAHSIVGFVNCFGFTVLDQVDLKSAPFGRCIAYLKT